MKAPAPEGLINKRGFYQTVVWIQVDMFEKMVNLGEDGASYAEKARQCVEYSLETEELSRYPREAQPKEKRLACYFDEDTWNEMIFKYNHAPPHIKSFAQFTRELIWNGI